MDTYYNKKQSKSLVGSSVDGEDSNVAEDILSNSSADTTDLLMPLSKFSETGFGMSNVRMRVAKASIMFF